MLSKLCFLVGGCQLDAWGDDIDPNAAEPFDAEEEKPEVAEEAVIDGTAPEHSAVEIAAAEPEEGEEEKSELDEVVDVE